MHVRLLPLFRDAPAVPFGVHWMALARKAAGKDVGTWLGQSTSTMRAGEDDWDVPGVQYPFPVSGEGSTGAAASGATAPQQKGQERQRHVSVSPRAGSTLRAHAMAGRGRAAS
ncbi:hypothetical protein C8R44DRAFT_736587 [Mycena epipterygia]|nr:hypothetical protein C8R44DRAFT_736587 [Mycena epipterygia]